ncbi:MAG: L-rhamnose mutarotase [Oscillospiraceae bacterium]
MARYAWTWKVKPEYLDEYVELHRNVWPDVREEHTKAGYRNYSIFQNGNQFFYVFECDDPQKTNEYIAASEPCQRWNAITSKMIDGSFDWGEAEPVVYLEEVFHLD